MIQPVRFSCLCTVDISAEYCGHELNQLNNISDCTANNLYFCGASNLNKSAVIMKRCGTGADHQCQGPTPLLNPCRRLSTLDCYCTSTFTAYSGRGSQCGSSMTGRDCDPNMVVSSFYNFVILTKCFFNYQVYFCESGQVTPLDACTKGCADGKCTV